MERCVPPGPMEYITFHVSSCPRILAPSSYKLAKETIPWPIYKSFSGPKFVRKIHILKRDVSWPLHLVFQWSIVSYTMNIIIRRIWNCSVERKLEITNFLQINRKYMLTSLHLTWKSTLDLYDNGTSLASSNKAIMYLSSPIDNCKPIVHISSNSIWWSVTLTNRNKTPAQEEVMQGASAIAEPPGCVKNFILKKSAFHQKLIFGKYSHTCGDSGFILFQNLPKRRNSHETSDPCPHCTFETTLQISILVRKRVLLFENWSILVVNQ